VIVVVVFLLEEICINLHVFGLFFMLFRVMMSQFFFHSENMCIFFPFYTSFFVVNFI